MAEYTTAATSAEAALETAVEAGVEEYGVGANRVKIGTGATKARDLAFIEGMASRRSAGGMFKVGRFINPSQ